MNTHSVITPYSPLIFGTTTSNSKTIVTTNKYKPVASMSLTLKTGPSVFVWLNANGKTDISDGHVAVSVLSGTVRTHQPTSERGLTVPCTLAETMTSRIFSITDITPGVNTFGVYVKKNKKANELVLLDTSLTVLSPVDRVNIDMVSTTKSCLVTPGGYVETECSVTLDVVKQGNAFVWLVGTMTCCKETTVPAFFSVGLSGANTVDATDSRCVVVSSGRNVDVPVGFGRLFKFTNLQPGPTTFKVYGRCVKESWLCVSQDMLVLVK